VITASDKWLLHGKTDVNQRFLALIVTHTRWIKHVQS